MTKFRRYQIVTLLTACLLSACSIGSTKLPTEPLSPSELSPSQLAAVEIKKGAVVMDVRSQEEFSASHIDGALNIPLDKLESRVSELTAYQNQPLVIYCKSGRRAGIAEGILKAHGFIQTLNAGGYAELAAALGTNESGPP